MKNTKLFGLASILTACGIIVSTLTITFAGYERKVIIEDPTKTGSTSNNLLIGSDGKRLTSYYLDIGIWGTIDNTNYDFYAVAFDNSSFVNSAPQTFEFIKGELSGYNYKYRVDTEKYDRIKFFRTENSNEASLNQNNALFTLSYYAASSPGVGIATDGTGYLAFPPSLITFQITGWHTSSSNLDAVGYWR